MSVIILESSSKESHYSNVYYQKADCFTTDKIYKIFFEEVVPALKKQEGLRVTFGNMDGSISRGLSNSSSDVDMHVFGETDDDTITYRLLVGEAQIDGQNISYDLAPHSQNVTFQSVKEYDSRKRRYPSNFYRTDEEREKYSPEKIHWNVRYRDDGEMFEYTQFLIANTCFISKNHQYANEIERFYKKIRTIDLMDLQYVRAYGNYQNVIMGKVKVLVRKYLYTLYEIFICNWIMMYHSKPSMVFGELMDKQDLTDEEREAFNSLLKTNAEAKEHKTKLMCESNPVINRYICNKLDDLKVRFERYPVSERWDRIIADSTEAERQKIIYF